MRVARFGAASAALALLAGCGAARPAEKKTDTPAAVAASQAAGPVVASFDCAKASTALEKLICSDAALAKADRDLAAAYAAALKQTPAEWRDRLRDTQRGWLASAAAACKADASSCAEYFESRTQALGDTLSAKGGREFVTLTTYHATRDPDLAGPEDDPALWETARLQISRPDAEERRWNAMVAAGLDRIMDPPPVYGGEGFVDLASVAPGFIGARLHRVHVRGPGGESHQIISVPWSLKLGRALTPADVFVDPAAAKETVARLAFEQYRKDGDADSSVTLETFRTLTAYDRYWNYEAAGLSLAFDDDNEFGGAHRALTLGTTIPWADLAPYLRKDLPFDLKALRDIG
ncbi:DUF1311 domain-containing protein [Caulobacter sp. 17J65-9]|nr:DUF1311 domain-containing protein [Caulobacter sp. 17J65-9]